VGNSLGKTDHVTRSALKQLAAEIYLYFTGFDRKRLVGRPTKVGRRNIAGKFDPARAPLLYELSFYGPIQYSDTASAEFSAAIAVKRRALGRTRPRWRRVT
jgi:hypothetical protein